MHGLGSLSTSKLFCIRASISTVRTHCTEWEKIVRAKQPAGAHWTAKKKSLQALQEELINLSQIHFKGNSKRTLSAFRQASRRTQPPASSLNCPFHTPGYLQEKGVLRTAWVQMLKISHRYFKNVAPENSFVTNISPKLNKLFWKIGTVYRIEDVASVKLEIW